MNIIILGAPASGKGTQAELLSKKYHLYLLHSGDLSRKLAEKDERIRKIINSGQLIPEEEMSMYVVNFLDHEKPDLKNIIYEGFPRFISQYESLEKFLQTRGDKIDAVISLDISKEEAVKRISSRRICRKCGQIYNLITNPPKKPGICDVCGGELYQRKDDVPESIKTRFEFYKENTKQLIDYLDRKNKLIRVDGEKPVEEIYKKIVSKIEHARK